MLGKKIYHAIKACIFSVVFNKLEEVHYGKNDTFEGMYIYLQ